MNGRQPTAIEKLNIKSIRSLGCICCRRSGMPFSEDTTAIHHIRGSVKPNAHMFVLPLCYRHHQDQDNQSPKRWVSRHGDGRIAFEKEYGTEIELLIECAGLLARRAHRMVAAQNLLEVLKAEVGY